MVPSCYLTAGFTQSLLQEWQSTKKHLPALAANAFHSVLLLHSRRSPRKVSLAQRQDVDLQPTSVSRKTRKHHQLRLLAMKINECWNRKLFPKSSTHYFPPTPPLCKGVFEPPPRRSASFGVVLTIRIAAAISKRCTSFAIIFFFFKERTVKSFLILQSFPDIVVSHLHLHHAKCQMSYAGGG